MKPLFKPCDMSFTFLCSRLVANYLLKHGADVSFADVNGDTALHCAVRSGSLSVCASLLDYYASCDTVNGDRETSLHEAAKGDNADIVVLLLDKKANTELKNKREKTFLDLAIDSAHDEVLDAIMNHHRLDDTIITILPDYNN
jgi:ankyrin repeat protein